MTTQEMLAILMLRSMLEQSDPDCDLACALMKHLCNTGSQFCDEAKEIVERLGCDCGGGS